jgi:hypothetical protein
MALAGATLELAAEQLMERRLGGCAETMRSDLAGGRLRSAKLLTAGGITVALALAPRSRVASAAAGAAFVAGSVLTRFGIFAAGMASARDPRYTVEQQRARLAARP